MRRLDVDLEARFYLPDFGDVRGQRNWRWLRASTHLWIDVPSTPGENRIVQIPPPLFTHSAAWPWRLRFDYTNTLYFSLENMDGSSPVRWREWRESKLWSQVVFDPYITPDNNTRAWWLRWRTRNAERDIMSVVWEALDAVDAVDTLEEIEALAQTHDILKQLRRELVLDRLGRPHERETW